MNCHSSCYVIYETIASTLEGFLLATAIFVNFFRKMGTRFVVLFIQVKIRQILLVESTNNLKLVKSNELLMFVLFSCNLD